MTKRGRTWSIELTCVGLQFRWKKTGRETLARSVPFMVDLEREPDNRHDENAIKVVIASDFKLTRLRGKQLGYIRAKTAEQFAPWFDEGQIEVVKIWVTDINPATGDATLDCRFRDLRKAGK
jgi:HIRAN domain